VSEPGRSFAGYTYQQRLSVGFFGEVFRAVGADNRIARILHIGAHMVALKGFSEALATHGGELGLLEHKNAESTILVGTTPEGVCVVVTEGLAGPVSLAQVLTDVRTAGNSMPEAVAIGIVRSVFAALAHAHRVGIAHGCVHPRAVRIDIHGGVKLADFAASRALAAAAAMADDPTLLKSKGYLAPELALGDEPSRASDVYAAGALAFELLTGAPPPGSLPGPAELSVVIDKALATDPGVRYPTGVELRAAFELAIERSGAPLGSVKDVAAFVNELRSETEANLDAETEDVLAALAAEPALPSAPTRGGRASTVKSGDDAELDDVLDDLVAGLPVADPSQAPGQAPAAQHDDDRQDEDDEDDEALTEVDGHQLRDDPVSALIRANPSAGASPLVRLGSESDPDDEDTYIPPAMTDSDVELAEAAGRVSGRAGGRQSLSSKRASFRPPSGTDPVAPVVLNRKSGSGIWIFTTVVALAGLFAVLYTQTDVFHPERRKEKEHEREADLEARRAEAEAKRVRAGDVIVDSSVPEAAVWLLLGRTPVDSLPLSAGAVHQVRVEHEGYAPADFSVLGAQWTGSGNAMRARLDAKLVPAQPGGVVPALPPAPKRQTSGRTGRGTIRIESEPAGASAYLLVGFTPDMQLRGVRAGRSYDFKVVKDGYAPGFVVIRAEDWTNEAGGPRRSIERTAELAPLPPGPKK